jgi:biotin carboxyl carrier protein
MKIQVNGTTYDVEIIGEKIRANGRELVAKLDDDKIMIKGKTFYLDFAQKGDEGETSLMIINGMTYVLSKSSFDSAQIKEIKAPITGKVKDVFAKVRSQVKEGQLLATIEAMKMEIQIKSPSSGRIKEINVYKDQAVKTGQILLTFE